MLDRIVGGTIKLLISNIQLDKGKIFLLAAIEIEKNFLDASIIAEASLSIEHPVAVKIGSHEHAIGNKEEFLHRRLAIQVLYAV